MKSNVITLVKDGEPKPPKPERGWCWPFLHQWGNWERAGEVWQQRECGRCGKIKERII